MFIRIWKTNNPYTEIVVLEFTIAFNKHIEKNIVDPVAGWNC